MKLKLWKATLIFNIFLIAVFSVLCVWFIPNFADYVEAVCLIESIDAPSRAVIYGFAGSVATPCVVLLILALPLSAAIKNDSVFTLRTAARLAAIAYLMLIDCIVFLIGLVVLIFLGDPTFWPLFAIVDLIGFSVSILLLVLSGYIRRAAELKEEVDATL